MFQIVRDERAPLGLRGDRPEPETGIGADQRLGQLPFRVSTADRREQTLQTDREQRPEHNVKDDVEKRQLTCKIRRQRNKNNN